MTMPMFFADLDQTLIYSHNYLQKNNLTTAGHLVVEEHQGKPLSFMSLEAWELLSRHAGQTFNFVPTTTRNFEQYSRIRFPKTDVQAAIILNGAQIIVNGVVDEQWGERISEGLLAQSYQPSEVFAAVAKELEHDADVKSVRVADEVFVYIVAHTADCPKVDEFTTKLAEDTGYIRSKQGRKTYLIPSHISKGSAVQELRSRFGIETAYAAGDSNLDFSMIPEVDHFVVPNHGTVPPEYSHVSRTESQGIFTAEEILNYVIRG
jgi:hydroxymethylpyrimidine pyrophosphatase-like HAD family hydrolase